MRFDIPNLNFIRRPELAQIVERLVHQIDPALALELKTHYMAAAYLQRLWRTRLGFYIASELWREESASG